MEVYIKNEMPEMEMVSYKMNYTNHKHFHNNKDSGLRYGSPIRIFTNIPLSAFELPDEYTYCKICKRWKSSIDIHCWKCRNCPSKNGATYVHCAKCAECVKPNYKHCVSCNRCTQVYGHNCIEYQKQIRCWICHTKGHLEQKCIKWHNYVSENKLFGQKSSQILERKTTAMKNGNKICYLCLNRNHNEKKCPKRSYLLNERIFNSETFNIFSAK